MRGRLPAGPEFIDKLDGAAEEKERLKAILDTMYGERRLLQACIELGIHETRFHQLRETAMQGALAAITRKPAGRPCRANMIDAAYVRNLEERVEELEMALHEAQVREEIALVLPRVTIGEPATFDGAKKMRRRHVKIRKPR
jgi:hypothetical protein